MTWGNPYRGPVTGGQVTLPNGEVRATVQPSGARTDEYGFTFLQRGPGAEADRTEAEQVIDEERGYTWRTDAILSGSSLYLYGFALNGYVYCAPDGTRWLIDLSGLQSLTIIGNSLSTNVTAKRFGEFNGEADERAMPLSMGDIGQDETGFENSIAASRRLILADLRPDGSAALLMIYMGASDYASAAPSEMCRYPLGWLELTMAGGADELTATLSVARNLIETLGEHDGQFLFSGEETIPGPGPTGFVRQEGNLNIYEHLGAPQTYTGREYLWEWSVRNRIVALWYAQEGFEELTITSEWQEKVESSVPVITWGGQNTYNTSSGAWTYGTWSRNQRDTLIETSGAISLKLGEEEIDRVSASSETIHRYDSDAYPNTPVMDFTTTLDGTTFSDTDLAGLTSVVDSVVYRGQTELPPFRVYGYRAGIEPLGYVYPLEHHAAAYSGRGFRPWLSPNGVPRPSDVVVNLRRYSNNLCALSIRKGGTTRTTHAAHPGGHDGTITDSAGTRYYGSYNPATGEVVRDQSTPICYV